MNAEELLKQSYGQMHFSNEDGGWRLLADRVVAYANMHSAKRSHTQQLLYFAVKNRSLRQLFALYHQLQLMRVPRVPN
ncbi:hypothetical protein [Janthinobacterium fluminis]|uniref:Uncharacterized protein n=1 Tax=Janthinobacterium fluminis TaxID=2987524 RepID=A0ABT5JZE2_9BURK|nr:hypothetical protein [Janthinobacterium fluminis]MDC8757851.1 hypothetical protein [Janthinobacterium fluminis]